MNQMIFEMSGLTRFSSTSCSVIGFQSPVPKSGKNVP
jgi:hypothetical protein